MQALPRWGQGVDEEVARYVRAVRDTVKANLWWSFWSGRFLTWEQKGSVRGGGWLWVLERPGFLQVGAEEGERKVGVDVEEEVGVRMQAEGLDGNGNGSGGDRQLVAAA